MHTTRLAFLCLGTVLILTAGASRTSVQGQGGDQSNWQTFSPEGEEFTVVMPKDPKMEEGQQPYHRMVLNTRLYLSATEHGPVFAIASFSGIKSNPAMYTESQRLYSYVDAFKNWFPQKIHGPNTVAKLTLVGDKTLNGNKGLEYKLVIGELAGTVQVFATSKRFYAAVVLNVKNDDKLNDRFLSSFVLPEKATEPVTSAVATDKTPAPGTAQNSKAAKSENSEEGQKNENAADNAPESKPVDAAGPTGARNPKAPISGGVLNGKALYLPPPEYPPIALQAKAAGMVTVQVLIDESGNVVSAHAVSGHPLLQAAAVNAALQAKFSPTLLMGEPVKVTGVITFNFVLPK
jgi:TonB family protein